MQSQVTDVGVEAIVDHVLEKPVYLVAGERL